MLKAGITCVGEFDYLHFSDALIAAANETGIRLTLLDACYLARRLRRARPTTRSAASATATPRAGPSACRQIKGAKVGAAIHSVRAVPADQIPTVVEWARGRPLHFHLSEQRAENEACLAAHGCTPTQLLARARRARPGLHRRPRHAPDARTTSALLHETTICMCPTTERDLADGIGRAGPNLSLGSDSHAVIDLFEEARAVELNLRLATERRGHFTAAALLRGATNHASLGWPDAGRIEPGALADLVTVGLDSPRLETAGARDHARIDRVRGHRGRRPQRDRGRQAVLIDNIGTLVTNDPELGTIRDAALVFGDGVVQWAGPSKHAPGGRRRRALRRAAAAPSSPASSTPTATSCSPATARTSSRRGWPASRTRRAASARRSRPRATPPTTQLGANVDRLIAEALRSGTTTVETQVRLRPDRPRRAPQPHDRDAAHRRAHVPRRPRRPARARRRRLRRARQGRDARRLRAARALDRRLLRARRVRRRPDPRDPRRPASPRASRRASTPTSSATAPACRSRSSSERPPPTTSRTRPTTTSTRWPTATPSRRCCPAPSSAPARAYPDARRLLDAGVTVALAADCNPGTSYTTSIPFCIALAVREMGMTPDEAVVGRDRGRREGAPARPTSATSAPARGRRRPARRAHAHPPRLPAGRAARRGRVAARALDLQPALGLGSQHGQADDNTRRPRR